VKKIIFLSIVVALFTGCVPKSNYKMSIYNLDVTVSDINSPKNNKVIMVKYPDVLGPIGGSRIYYKRDNETNYYLYSRWSGSLSSLIYKDILTSLQNSNRFKSVVGYNSSADANIVLEIQIIDFYHIVDKTTSYVKITIGIKYIDKNSGKIIKSRVYSYKKDIPIANAKNFVIISKEALKEFLSQL